MLEIELQTQGKKSILLNAAKKQLRLKRDSSTSRVRFSEDAFKSKRACLPMSPKEEKKSVTTVLKVFIEANQTRSFKYDSFTCVKVSQQRPIKTKEIKIILFNM